MAESASAGATFRQAMALWRRYDLAVIAQTGTRPFLFGWAAGRQRIGLVSPDVGKSWWKRALLDRYAVFDGGAARVLENQRIAALLGLDAAPIVVPPSAGWGPLEVGRALGFDPTVNRYAVVHPSPRWRYKQWTREGWRELIRSLAGQGLRVVVTGGPGATERAYLDTVLAGVGRRHLYPGRWPMVAGTDRRRSARRRALRRPGHGNHASGRRLRNADRGDLRPDRSCDMGSMARARRFTLLAGGGAATPRQCAVDAEPGPRLRAVPARRLRPASRESLGVP